jgi:telomerase reverse transcriptase
MECMLERHRKTRYARLLDIYCPRKVSQQPEAMLLQILICIVFRLPPVACAAERTTLLGKPRLNLYDLSRHYQSRIPLNSGVRQVIRYVRAVLKKVMPESFWGSKRNLRVVHDGKRFDTNGCPGLMRNADGQGIKKLVLGKRYETFSIHHLLQGISVDEFSWLHSSSGQNGGRVNVSEHVTRRRLVEELVFWLYDGFLIPLIRVRSTYLLWSR